MAAEVVAAPLHVADLQRSEQRFEEGYVFEEELLLQVFGTRRDDDALLALASETQSGQKVGKGLAGAGARFDDEVAFFLEGGLDGPGHLVLASPVLEGEGGLGEDASRGEEIVKRGQALGGCGLRSSYRDGGRRGHRDGLAYDSRTPPPPPAQVRKVFEVDTLGLDFGLSLRSTGKGFPFLDGASGGQVCQEQVPKFRGWMKESGSRGVRIPTHRMRQRRDEWGSQFGAWDT